LSLFSFCVDMKTRLDVADVIAEIPQQRALVRLFDEDTNQLRVWTNQLLDGIERLTSAQNLVTEATRSVGATISQFNDRRFPLDEVELDMPQLTARLSAALNEQANGMELLAQQLDNCVRYPISKMHKELESLVEKASVKYESIQEDLIDAEEKYMKCSRKDSKKSNELLGELTMARNRYNSEAIDYVTRMNGIQSTRYTLLIEPLLSLLHAFKSFHSVGAESCKTTEYTSILTEGQEKMQSVVRADQISRKGSAEKLSVLTNRLNDDDFDVSPACSSHNKQGYLRIRMKTGLFTSNWDRFFIFVQGTSLMHQRSDDLVSEHLVSLQGSTVSEATEADRRYVFIVTQPSRVPDRQLTFQACSNKDLIEWINVIRNLAVSSSSPVSNLQIDESELDITSHPIQFDLLTIGQLPSPSSLKPNENRPHFEVRFLGSVQMAGVPSGGEQAVQASIDKVLLARKIHEIESPHPVHLICSSRRVLLKDANDETTLKAFFDFSDIALWMVSKRNENHFALITSAKDNRSDEEGIHLMCSVLEAADGAANVCSLLAQETSDAFQEAQGELSAVRLAEKKKEDEKYESFSPIGDH
ncbi:hypothetical protein PENTCL1PPCAC_18207, partial [Pristionchus entomophagus]